MIDKNNIADQTKTRPRLLFVGAFPPDGKKIFGGNVTDCRSLMQSSFPKRLRLDLIDSTQISNPPPAFVVRLLIAIRRFFLFIVRFELGKPDAVLIFTGSGAGLVEKGLMGWYVRLRNGRSFLFPRGGGLLSHYANHRVVPGWIKLLLKSSEKILCQGVAWQELVTHGLGRPLNEAPVISSWTATPRLLSIGKARDRKTVCRPIKLLFVGWIEHEKGVMELLKAFRELMDENKYTLELVGHGKLFSTAETFVKENDLNTVVKLSGWKDGMELEKKLRDSDVFVLPSWIEGLPNAMIEAMAAGLCIVATSVGNIPEVIRNGENGLLVPPKNIESLKFAIKKVLINDELRTRLSINAYETAMERFSVERAVDRLIHAMFSNSYNKKNAC